MAEKIYIGADHAGFALKEKLVEELNRLGYEPVDVGPKTLDPLDDFPDFAKPVAGAVGALGASLQAMASPARSVAAIAPRK